jgi:uncharacterized protein
MARVVDHVDDLGVESPYLLEGLPGVGLVGKIATDHLVSQWDMRHVASCHCEGIPDVAVYGEGEYAVRPPVRIYADAERNLLALQSDVPISPQAATEFASCVTEWLEAKEVTPIYLTGLATGEKGDVPGLYGVATGAGGDTLREHDISPPPESGLVSGPTGGLIAEANERGLDSVGLIVESNPQFPDPEAARAVLTNGVGPITDTEIDTDQLVEQAEEIADAKETLAQRMQQESEDSSAAQPVGMYQ